MKANISSSTIKSGEFCYQRKSRTLKAYGQEYVIPVRTVELSEKLEDVGTKISSCTRTSETVAAILDGIAVFIGAEETTRIFGKESKSIDVDEVLAFWKALNYELGEAQNELLAKYAPAPMRLPSKMLR